MSDLDKALIQKAQSLHFTQWMDIDTLINKSESDEARERLRIIRNKKYHQEEYYSYTD